ncbi:MAG TPA: FAD-dependent oxidoreductase [Solirubrobacteraceae bacterium]|nr:FAD-dependent oxidoreductase [Solirubrobacteraceae bacterium]
MTTERHVDYALIGGGLAAGNCARWLRESGADGSILLIGREADLPYNRPPLSKGYLQDKESRAETLFRPPEWYEEQNIEALTRVSATKLDLSNRTVALSNKQEVGFGKALIATGAGVRRVSVPGAELEGIHYLRTLGNSDAIRQDAAGKRVVLVGGSYIATEVAASLTELGSSCSLVMIEPVALSRGFGEQAGRFFQDRLEEHGIEVFGEDELDRFDGSDGRVTHVVTRGGRRLEADVVVVGVGAVPDVRLSRTAGLEIGERGGVKVDSRLETSVPGIFAAGDIAEYESVVHGGQIHRIEHWDVAFNQGKTAALNMLDRDQPHDVVPYFFSDLSDWASLEYVGPAGEWDQEVVRGSIDAGEFTIFYLRDGRVAGALTVGRSDDLEHAGRLLTSGASVQDRVPELGDLSSDLAFVADS